MSLSLPDLQNIAAYNCIYLHYGKVSKLNLRNYYFIMLGKSRQVTYNRITYFTRYEQMGLFILEGDQVKHTPLFIRFINEYEKELKKKINEVKKRAKERGYEL